jgi:hypothetical protein
MRKKYSFSDYPEHKEQLAIWRDKWIANAMSTKPMDDYDKAQMRIAIKGLYESAGLTPPPEHRIVFVSSPFIARFAGGYAAAIWYLRKNKNLNSDAATHAATRAATEAAANNATRAATHYATDIATGTATDAATNTATYAATNTATYDATNTATYAATNIAIDAATRDATRNATDSATYAATDIAIDAATRAVARAATNTSTYDATYAAIYNATDAAANTAAYAATRDATDTAIYAATRAATHAATYDATHAATYDATHAATNTATDAVARAATHDATYYATHAATRAATHDATYYATYAAANIAIDAATNTATYAATNTATYDATNTATYAATNIAIDAATRAVARAATNTATYNATYAATRNATDSATRAATDIATEAAAEDATYENAWYSSVEGMVDVSFRLKLGKFGLECAYKSGGMYQGGNFWSAFDCFLSFFRHVAKLDIDYSKYQYWEMAAQHGSYRIMHKEFCIISDRPEILTVDEQNRPHGEGKPFCKWRDGMSLYAWHGVSIPEWWVTHKEKLTPEIALKWENLEQRRAACEILGWANILRVLEAKTIDKDNDPTIGELVEVTLPDSGKERFLKVRCGTNREFALIVPPDINTAVEANLWTYNLPKGSLLPEVRT